VPRFDQFDRALQGCFGGSTVVNPNEDAVEHGGLPLALIRFG
jgi:hypothetical protein